MANPDGQSARLARVSACLKDIISLLSTFAFLGLLRQTLPAIYVLACFLTSDPVHG
jgi:hypothetical protein